MQNLGADNLKILGCGVLIVLAVVAGIVLLVLWAAGVL